MVLRTHVPRLVEVELLDADASERGLDRLPHLTPCAQGEAPLLLGIASGPALGFRGQHHALARPARDSSAHPCFRVLVVALERVRAADVEIVHAELQSAVDDRGGIVAVLETHGAEPEGRHLDAGVTDFAILHGSILLLSGFALNAQPGTVAGTRSCCRVHQAPAAAASRRGERPHDITKPCPAPSEVGPPRARAVLRGPSRQLVFSARRAWTP